MHNTIADAPVVGGKLAADGIALPDLPTWLPKGFVLLQGEAENYNGRGMIMGDNPQKGLGYIDHDSQMTPIDFQVTRRSGEDGLRYIFTMKN
ncbi:hypothetical protein DPMN_040201 [Dreissena polymorpha]|uniref:Uncharacterized protein n=1 Tax=Dreissena polymorpha TaxID=45954 RepID=A0A9D4CWF9_DREPO|nr:hypothetical protein DPMN_040201 [Dreissena polymorpha]